MKRWRGKEHWLGLVFAGLLGLAGGCNGGDVESRDGAAGSEGDVSNDSAFGGSGGSVPTSVTGGSGGSESGQGGAGGAGVRFGFEGLTENPVDILVANPDRSAWNQLTEIDVGSSNDYALEALACYGSADACGEPECAVFASCCVGTGSCCVPVTNPSLPELTDLGSCAGQSIGACAATFGVSLVPFGPGDPSLTSRGLVPGGDATSEAGVIVGGSVDLGANRIELEVELTLPLNCGPSCLESAGVAFSGESPGALVDAGLGLLLSGSRNEVNLMVGNAVADTYAVPNGSTVWTLVASPQGRVEVLRDGQRVGTHSFSSGALRDASLVVFGRNLNPAGQNAAVRSLRVASAVCDEPSAWESRNELTITDDFGMPLPEDRFGQAPAIGGDGSELRVAYEIDAQVFWGRALGPGSVELIDTAPAIAPAHAHDAQGVFQPELVFDGTTWHAFYTARDQSGTGSIGHGTAEPLAASFTTDPGPTLAPTADEVSLDSPTVHFRDGLWVLVVRATLADGETELRAYYATELGSGWARIGGGNLEALTRSADVGSAVTGPSLIVHDSAYQLYVARREGTRWSIDILVSDELLVWRSAGLALGASSDSEAFDSVGARAPDAISLTDRVDVVYEGQDGVSFVLGRATRQAPSDGAPDF